MIATAPTTAALPTIAAFLERAEDRIHLRADWCARVCARDPDGRGVEAGDATAVQWDAVGALLTALDDIGADVPGALWLYRKARQRIEKMAVDLHGRCLRRVNDELGHLAVTRTYRTAIAVERLRRVAGR